jgi:hypothetical protein
MKDSLGHGNISTLENPVGVANDTGKKPHAREGVCDQGPAEAVREIE